MQQLWLRSTPPPVAQGYCTGMRSWYCTGMRAALTPVVHHLQRLAQRVLHGGQRRLGVGGAAGPAVGEGQRRDLGQGRGSRVRTAAQPGMRFVPQRHAAKQHIARCGQAHMAAGCTACSSAVHRPHIGVADGHHVCLDKLHGVVGGHGIHLLKDLRHRVRGGAAACR